MSFGTFKLRLLIGGMVSCLLLSNCKPDTDPAIADSGPLFQLKGTINGAGAAIVATGDYYMFSGFNYNTADSLYSFTGRIENAKCQNCGEAIEVTFYNNRQSLQHEPVDIIGLLQQPTYQFANSNAFISKEYSLQFRAEDSGYVNPGYQWSFGGALHNDSLSKTAIVTFKDTATRRICLTITDKNNGCTKTICNYVKPFEVEKGDSLVPDFGFINQRTTVFVNYSKAESYLWDLGDGRTSVAYNPEHLYNTKTTYQVTLNTTNKGVQRNLMKNVVINDPLFSCLANYSYHSPKVKIDFAKPLSKIKIWYRDNSGEVYQSNLQEQPITSVFALNSHESYVLNEKGQKTRSIAIAFKCRVFSTTTASFKDLDLTGRIAVALP